MMRPSEKYQRMSAETYWVNKERKTIKPCSAHGWEMKISRCWKSQNIHRIHRINTIPISIQHWSWIWGKCFGAVSGRLNTMHKMLRPPIRHTTANPNPLTGNGKAASSQGPHLHRILLELQFYCWIVPAVGLEYILYNSFKHLSKSFLVRNLLSQIPNLCKINITRGWKTNSHSFCTKQNKLPKIGMGVFLK